MIEVLEHLVNPEQALQNLRRFFTKDTVAFITIPNCANGDVINNEQKHGFHLHHWNAGDFYALMTKNFASVVMYSVDKLENWGFNETIDGNSTDYLIFA